MTVVWDAPAFPHEDPGPRYDDTDLDEYATRKGVYEDAYDAGYTDGYERARRKFNVELQRDDGKQLEEST